MLKKILVLIIVAVAIVLCLAMLKPNTFTIQRSTTINAPPDKVFAILNDFHNWQAWSPFEKLDPAMKRTISGPPSGPGAVYEWSGNDKAGAGRMEITEATAPSHIAVKLDFIKPFEGHDTAEYTLQPVDSSTNVTWSMHGPNPLMSKVVQVFMNMDKMVGKDFEEGLSNLKAIAEKPAGRVERS